ncbi:dynein light chain LC8-type [Strigomonas culicis]|uniref:Dynein light chain n=1 Tax=Strigomonas culicis TaxID=28005 RepID=S9W382_9TRYP|nr:dynein light chain LC8-type [Strigomonas culicis]|eukprot:EPY33806.1 dynein light chain LC8-type [Strigomonas culicis]
MGKITDMNYNADMSKEMIEDAHSCVLAAFDNETSESAVATYIKREFVRKYKGIWHCVVGKNFGSFVTHEMKHYIYLTWGPVSVLLWKSVS